MLSKLEELILATCELPTMPAVAGMIMTLIADPKTSVNRLQEAIAADQGLATRVLKIANSAFYQRHRSVDTVTEAIVLMGLRTLRSLVLAATMKGIYKRYGLAEHALWEHALGVAIASLLLAREAGLPDPEEAMVEGLLHDVGKVVMNNAQADRYARVIQRVYNDGVSALDAEQEVFGFCHPEVGALLVRRWNLAESLEAVVRHHHHPAALREEDPSLYRRALLVRLADLITLSLGIGPARLPDEVAVAEEEGWDFLGIPRERAPALVEQIYTTIQVEKGTFE